MSLNQLKTILVLQDKLNCQVNPDWRDADQDWPMACLAECTELADHLGWKWWKKQQPNLPQAKLELVDIWHFVMSSMLQKHGGDCEAAALEIKHILNHTRPFFRQPSRIGFYLAQAIFKGLDDTFSVLFQVMEQLGLGWDELYTTYVAKNVLNMFRQENGYKEGTYVKVWRGQEDNDVLADILKANPSATPDELAAALSLRYSDARA